MHFKILQKYVLRELLAVFAMALTVTMAVVCFAMVVTFMRYSPRLEMLVQSLPWLALQGLYIVLPFAFLITVTLVYGRLSRDNEITAIAAGGVSVYFFIGPALMLCLWVIFGNIMVNDYLVPRARWELEGLIHRNASDLLQRRIPTKPELDEFGPVHLVYEVYDYDSDQLVNVRIRYYGEAQQLLADIEADRATVDVLPDEYKLMLKLMNPRGVIFENTENAWAAIENTKPADAADGDWFSKEFDWRPMRQHIKRIKMMTRPELKTERNDIAARLARADSLDRAVLDNLITQRQWRQQAMGEARARLNAFDARAAAPDDPRRKQAQAELAGHNEAYAQIQTRIGELGGSREGIENRKRYLRETVRRIDTEFYRRYSFAFSSLVYALIGVPVAIALKRAHMLAAFGIGSLFVFAVFWPLLMIGSTLSEKGTLAPWLALALPHAALGLPGIALNLKLLGRG